MGEEVPLTGERGFEAEMYGSDTLTESFDGLLTTSCVGCCRWLARWDGSSVLELCVARFWSVRAWSGKRTEARSGGSDAEP